MKIYASSPQGNAWVITGMVRELLIMAGRKDEWPAIAERMRSGDYRNLCEVAKEVTFGTIEIIDDLDNEEDD